MKQTDLPKASMDTTQKNGCPKVSSCIISYTQEDFIEATLQASMAQSIGADHEIVAGDDHSTDKTLDRIEKLAKTDSRIRILKTEKNLGMHGNWARTIAACQGKYIALCEGDDFWNDPHKVQKQVDLLEQNPEASACFSNAFVVDENGNRSEFPYVDVHFGILKAEDFFKLDHNPIPTCTLVFRSSFFEGFPKEYYNSPFADWILHTLLIQKGPYIYLSESTSSYRKHTSGVWTGLKKEKQLKNKLKALQVIFQIVEPRHKANVNAAIRNHLDKQLYFYRETKQFIKFFRTWLKLKITER